MATWVTAEESQQLYGTPAYTGWGKTEAAADARAKGINVSQPTASTGGQAASSGSGFPGNLGNILGQAFNTYQQFAQPAVNTLNSLKGDINAQYDTILNRMRGKTETTASRELGARGIPLSSTSAQQFINEQTQGVEQDVTAARLGALSNVGQNIAQIQANAPAQALSTGLSAYGATQNNQTADLSASLPSVSSLGAQFGFGGLPQIPTASAASQPSSLTQSTTQVKKPVQVSQTNTTNPLTQFGAGLQSLLGLGGYTGGLFR